VVGPEGMKLLLLLIGAMAILSTNAHASRMAALRRAAAGQVGSGTLLNTPAATTSSPSSSFAIPPGVVGGQPADKTATPNMASPPSTHDDAAGAAQAMLAGQIASNLAKKIDVANAKREQQLNSVSSVSSATSNSLSSSSAISSQPSLVSSPPLPTNSWISSSLLFNRQCDQNPKMCLYKVKEVPHLNEELKELLHKQEKQDEKVAQEELLEGEDPDLPNNYHDQHSQPHSSSSWSPSSRSGSSVSRSASTSTSMRFSAAQVNPAHLQAIAKANEKEEFGFLDPISRAKQMEEEKWENRKEAERVSLRTHFQLVAEREGSSLLSEDFDRSHGLSPTMSISTNLIRQAEGLLPTADIRHERFHEEHEKNCMGKICPREKPS
jgi:hypothetical protein